MDKYIELYRIAAEFRGGIEQALDSGEFLEDIFFRSYPHACCGDTSLLLGHHLLGKVAVFLCHVGWEVTESIEIVYKIRH